MNILKFVPMVQELARLSKDPSTKVGAAIFGPGMEVRALGWNGFPRGVVDSEERLNDRPTKLAYTAHAEANAISNAARSGVAIEGCSLLVTALYPCAECCKLIIQAGIDHVFAPLPDDDGRWADSFEVSATMFKEAGIEITFY